MVGRHDHVIARADDLVVHLLAGAEGADEAVALLDDAEARAGVPLVDEAERERLRGLVEGRTGRAPHWHSLLVRRGDDPVGYAGLVMSAEEAAPAIGDVALGRDRGPRGTVLTLLLDGVGRLASEHGAARVQVWLRRATRDDIGRAADAGFQVDRRLGVLGRDLDGLPAVELPAGVTVRRYRPDLDDDGVVAVLAAAYADTPERGWDLARFRARRDLDWFRPEDLLVAEDASGSILGLHWLKRRTPEVGEVYNLAVGPDARGLGLGPALLAAGLAHLASVGCLEVVLWVDLANERAVRLYTSAGFETRWEDVALGRAVGDAAAAGD